MGWLIFGVITVVVFGTFGLMLIGEKCATPWEKEIGIGKRREVAYDDYGEIEDIIDKIDWGKIEPDKTYEFVLALGEEDDDEWRSVLDC